MPSAVAARAFLGERKQFAVIARPLRAFFTRQADVARDPYQKPKPSDDEIVARELLPDYGRWNRH